MLFGTSDFFPWETDSTASWLCASLGLKHSIHHSWLGPHGESLEKSNLTLNHFPFQLHENLMEDILDIFKSCHFTFTFQKHLCHWTPRDLNSSMETRVIRMEATNGGFVGSEMCCFFFPRPLPQILCSPSMFLGISSLALDGTCQMFRPFP